MIYLEDPENKTIKEAADNEEIIFVSFILINNKNNSNSSNNNNNNNNGSSSQNKIKKLLEEIINLQTMIKTILGPIRVLHFMCNLFHLSRLNQLFVQQPFANWDQRKCFFVCLFEYCA